MNHSYLFYCISIASLDPTESESLGTRARQKQTPRLWVMKPMPSNVAITRKTPNTIPVICAADRSLSKTLTRKSSQLSRLRPASRAAQVHSPTYFLVILLAMIEQYPDFISRFGLK